MMTKQDLTADEIRARYNAQAEVYQTRYIGLKGEYYARFEDPIFLEFLEVDGKRVLDLGTGRGRLALMLAGRAKEIVGIDLSDEMIRFAKQAGEGTPNVHFERGDAARLRFADGYFDCVSSVGMFPYVRDVEPFFTEINRVLKPGGTFAFSIANAAEWHVTAQAEHVARHTFARLRGREFSQAEREPSPLIPHDVRELDRSLAATGFELTEHRSTFFYLPSRLFYAAGRRSLAPLKTVAASLNTLLGRLPVMRDHGKVVVLCARKRTDQIGSK
jgi:ubiquinone/menaquinone biosynthesis C-methylase UbiE